MKNPFKLFENANKSCYLLNDRFYINYFCETDISEGYVVLDKDGVTCFTDARYFYQAKPKLISAGVNAMLYKDLDSVKEYIDGKGYTTVYIDFDTATVRNYEEYKNKFQVVLDGAENLKKLRAVKTESELERIKKACEITQKSYYEALKSVKEGMTESELRDILVDLYLKNGAEGESFDTIVAFGANSAVPHHETGETKLSKGMPILIDTGCRVNGYLSDYTRTAYFGTPTERFKYCYEAVKKANEYAIEKITAKTPCNVADGYARDTLKEHGLDKNFTHSLGHGIGLQVHEYPMLSPKYSDGLENGNVFTIEPGVYFDGEFGIRIEDTVVLKDGLVERLFSDGKDLIIINKD